jgi:lipopolysaccharide cholinephosphotransferase
LKPLTDQEIKQVTLGIMKEVKRVCSLLGLRYFLAWGTLLGAIRHKGFIPWDDDADFFMFRAEYEQLVAKFNDMASPRYRLLAPGTTKGYYYTFAKVVDTMTVACESGMHDYLELGIWLDLFPLDYLPATPQGVASQNSLIGTYLKRRYIALWRDYRFIGKFWSLWEFVVLLFSRHPVRLFSDSANEICREFNAKIQTIEKIDKRFVRTAIAPGYKKIWDAKDFDSAVELPFEDEVFSAPIGFANILEQSYGDYMTPPPMRKRNEKHYKYAKWKER